MKKLFAAAALASALVGVPSLALGDDQSSLDLGAVLRDGETGFVIGGEQRPLRGLGLVAEAEGQFETLPGDIARDRLRAGIGAGYHFGEDLPQYTALTAGLVSEWFDHRGTQRNFYVQGRYEVRALDDLDAGADLIYYSIGDGGFAARLYGRYYLNDQIAVQASYTADIDDLDGLGEDAVMLGIRYTPRWL